MLPLIEAKLLENAVTIGRIDRLTVVTELVPCLGVVGDGIELIGSGQVPEQLTDRVLVRQLANRGGHEVILRVINDGDRIDDLTSDSTVTRSSIASLHSELLVPVLPSLIDRLELSHADH